MEGHVEGSADRHAWEARAMNASKAEGEEAEVLRRQRLGTCPIMLTPNPIPMLMLNDQSMERVLPSSETMLDSGALERYLPHHALALEPGERGIPIHGTCSSMLSDLSTALVNDRPGDDDLINGPAWQPQRPEQRGAGGGDVDLGTQPLRVLFSQARGMSPAATYAPQQLIGGMVMPPSAFATQGDPLVIAARESDLAMATVAASAVPSLFPPRQRTTDADFEVSSGLILHDYACPPSANATHGDPLVRAVHAYACREQGDLDIFAPSFDRRVTTAVASVSELDAAPPYTHAPVVHPWVTGFVSCAHAFSGEEAGDGLIDWELRGGESGASEDASRGGNGSDDDVPIARQLTGLHDLPLDASPDQSGYCHSLADRRGSLARRVTASPAGTWGRSPALRQEGADEIQALMLGSPAHSTLPVQPLSVRASRLSNELMGCGYDYFGLLDEKGNGSAHGPGICPVNYLEAYQRGGTGHCSGRPALAAPSAEGGATCAANASTGTPSQTDGVRSHMAGHRHGPSYAPAPHLHSEAHSESPRGSCTNGRAHHHPVSSSGSRLLAMTRMTSASRRNVTSAGRALPWVSAQVPRVPLPPPTPPRAASAGPMSPDSAPAHVGTHCHGTGARALRFLHLRNISDTQGGGHPASVAKLTKDSPITQRLAATVRALLHRSSSEGQRRYSLQR